MKRLLPLLALLVFVPVISAQTGFSGTWSGSFVMTVDGSTRDDVAYMVLEQKGNELTGTAGPSVENQWPVMKGKIAEGVATFDVQSDGPLVHITLKLVEGRLKGDAKGEMDGRQFSGVFDLERKK